MAKTPQTAGKPAPEPGPLGHNAGKLTRDEQGALMLSHLDKIRRANAEVERGLEVVRALKKSRKVLRDACRGDGFPLKEIDEILDEQGKTQGERVAQADQRYWMRVAAGLPVGSQTELFLMPTLVRDEKLAEEDGYQAFMAGKECKVPDYIDSSMVQPWTKGWHRAEEKIAWSMAEAGKIVDRRDLNYDDRTTEEGAEAE